MFENRYPIFKRGNVLDKLALDLLRDNPLEILSLMYKNKSDGIISGFDLKVDQENREITITKGIVKCNDELFFLNEDYKINMPIVEDTYILKLKIESNIEDKKYYIRKGEFALETDFKLNPNEIEITRFITREGAELRNNYQNFHDLRRDFNLLEIINTKYSSNNILGTLHPTITRLWGLGVCKKNNLDIFDVNFYLLCLQTIVERESIIAYINIKCNLNNDDYTNEELYMYLLQILNELGNEREITEKKKIIPKKISIE